MVSKDFITTYKEYATTITDAPSIFHECTALAGLATCIGRVPIRVTPTDMFPNVYFNLIGQTTLSRKTTVTKILKKIIPENLLIQPDEFSPEGFVENLKEKPRGLVIIDEFGELLRMIKGGRKWMVGLEGIWMKLYDCPETYERTLRQEDITVKNPFINILAGTTPTSFFNAVDEHDIGIGWFGRVCHICGEREKRLPRMRRGETFTLKEGKLARWLEKIRKNPPKEFVFDDKVLRYLNDWEEKKEAEMLAKADDIFSAIAGRYIDYVIKLSAIYEVSATDPTQLGERTISISMDSLKRAITFVEDALKDIMGKIVTQIQSAPLNKLFGLISHYQTTKYPDGVPHWFALQYSNMPTSRFHEYIDTLIESGRIESVPTKSDKGILYRVKEPEESLQKEQPIPTAEQPSKATVEPLTEAISIVRKGIDLEITSGKKVFRWKLRRLVAIGVETYSNIVTNALKTHWKLKSPLPSSFYVDLKKILRNEERKSILSLIEQEPSYYKPFIREKQKLEFGPCMVCEEEKQLTHTLWLRCFMGADRVVGRLCSACAEVIRSKPALKDWKAKE